MYTNASIASAAMLSGWFSTGQSAVRLDTSKESVRRWAVEGKIDGADRLTPSSPWRIPRGWVVLRMQRAK